VYCVQNLVNNTKICSRNISSRLASRRSRSFSFSVFFFSFIYAHWGLDKGYGFHFAYSYIIFVCTLSDSAGPVELKRATLGSEDRPRVGVDRGLGARSQKKNRQEARAAAVGSQGWPCSHAVGLSPSVVFCLTTSSLALNSLSHHKLFLSKDLMSVNSRTAIILLRICLRVAICFKKID
jgi:hypothetical protein